MTRLVVLADTHVRRGSSRRLPDEVYEELGRADGVLHAGDIVVTDLLHELSGFAPTYAVLGNNDEPALTAVLPEVRLETIGGVTIGLIHDSGPTAGREGRLRRRFPTADLVVFGHSHIPWDKPGLEGQWLLNPGSPTDRRRQPHCTYGIVEADAGRFKTSLRTIA